MIRSLYSGVSGLQAHQTKLNVIGNNIANVNTYGFKSSRVVFSDVLYQNLSNANAASSTSGGTNASQLGYGSKVGSIDVNNSIASGADTGRSLDVYINGEGYLAVQGAGGTTKYTRVGNLKFDAAGNLTDANGGKILGIPTDASGNPILNADGTLPVSDLKTINVDPAILEKCTGVAIGKSGEITGTQAGAPEFTKASGFGWLTSVDVPATSNYTGDVKVAIGKTVFTKSDSTPGSENVDVNIAADIGAGDLALTSTNGVYTLKGSNTAGTAFSVTGKLTGTTLTFDTNNDGTADVTIANAATNFPTAADDYTLGSVATDTTVIRATVTNQGGETKTFDVAWDSATTDTSSKLTIGTGTDAITLTVDSAGLLTAYNAGLSTSKIGTIEAGSSVPKSLGYIAIAKFANTDGLSQDGNGYSIQSENSGNAVASIAGTNETGKIISSELESSNVDLSKEFTEMIIAQRGFQACSRVITVSDTILEELINLKR
ncbi:flagellar hook-basal body complex protein [Acetobacterium paludosum]|uniref:Flagellar hook protein FlgE n=1 Tax=Acetobacterium paludosum TaxID=52693 RepID=A0A923KWP7_9FIRM|nr:flagellar hook-basal body complex protein [Acetobacterium paludosum]MBC3888650.1 flagellar hook-basal body complex protein [Acetobacterium paludosum]